MKTTILMTHLQQAYQLGIKEAVTGEKQLTQARLDTLAREANTTRNKIYNSFCRGYKEIKSKKIEALQAKSSDGSYWFHEI